MTVRLRTAGGGQTRSMARLSFPVHEAARAVPKTNGVWLLLLGFLVLGIGSGLFVGASRHALGRSNVKHFDATVKWTWGPLGFVGGPLLIALGIYIIATGN